MPKPTAQDLVRPWGTLRVWESGTGPAVLAIHGLGGSGRYWDGLARALGRDHRVLAPDLAGFGATAAPDHGTDRDAHLDDLAAVVKAFAPEQPLVVVGHSLGGALAAMLTARGAFDVRGLAVAAAPFPGDGDLDFRFYEAPAWRRTMVRLLRPAWPAMAWPVSIAKGYPYEVVRDFGRQSYRARIWTMYSVLSDADAATELEPLRARAEPTLLLDAVDDTLVPVEDRRRWAEAIPSAEQVILPSGGHQLLIRTRFEPLARFVRRVSPR